MAYQVLARKWRPKNFTQLVGQTHVQKALLNALETQQLHHAYLFTGTRGVGKTTIARILARCLNCDEGVTTTPCGVCSSCCEINEGRFPDLIEVDAASRTKVEDTRELLDNVQYAPVRGRYKVYLIDEVHMLSTHSFNALLKTLEEPPPHVKFLLATTDPQKLPATILSRCLQFHLKNMSPEYIVSHLNHVLSQESITFDEEALWQLANAAQGSMRDAMSLTDQAIAFGAGSVLQADVREMLGTIDRASAWEIIDCIQKDDRETLFQHIDVLAQHSVDFAGLLDELLHCLHLLMREQIHPMANKTGPDAAACEQLLAATNIEQVQLYYQIALNGRKDIGFAPTARLGFEVVVLRLLAFKPLAIDEQIAGQDDAVKKHDAGVVAEIAAPASTTESIALVPPVPAVQHEPVSNPADRFGAPPPMPEPPPFEPDNRPEKFRSEPDVSQQPVRQQSAEVPVDQSLAETMLSSSVEHRASEHDASELINEHVSVAASSTVEPDVSEPIVLPQADSAQQLWLALFGQLRLEGMVKSIASHCELVSAEQNVWLMHMDPSMQAVYDDRYRNDLQTVLLSQVHALATPFRLDIHASDSVKDTPAIFAEALAKQQHQQALKSLQDDPNIQFLQEHFGGILRPDTVRLLPTTSD